MHLLIGKKKWIQPAVVPLAEKADPLVLFYG